MSDEYPFNFIICKLLSRNFSSKSPIGMLTYILRANHDGLLNSSFGQINVEHAWENDEVQVVWIIFQIIDEICDDVSHELCCSIAFPVSNNAIFSIVLHF